jgi:hypothetical protein
MLDMLPSWLIVIPSSLMMSLLLSRSFVLALETFLEILLAMALVKMSIFLRKRLETLCNLWAWLKFMLPLIQA